MPANIEGTLLYKESKRSGTVLETAVAALLKQYNLPCWRNILVPTKFARRGFTEVDLMFTEGETIYVIECKNIKAINGAYSSDEWTLIGASSLGMYNVLNVISQNNLHMHALSSLFYRRFKEFPVMDSYIIVPNGCAVDRDIQDSVMTIDEFEKQLRRLHRCNDNRLKLKIITALDGQEV